MTYLLVLIVVILFTCVCSMHFNLRKAAELRADDLIEMAKQDNELIELRHNMAEHHRLHSELNQILHPKGDGPKSPSLCDLVSYVRSDLREAYKAGFVDAVNNGPKMAADLQKLQDESRGLSIDVVTIRIEQVAGILAHEYVTNGKRVP